MLKELKLYYVYVMFPFVLLLLGSVIFFDAIKGTIIRNPHPQINYTIFCIIIIGGLLIMRSVHLLAREARALAAFSEAIRAETDMATLQEMAIKFDGAIAYVLRMLAASGGRSISHQEQTAIEHELATAKTRLTRRNALPQYLSGLLVGMGLLGTFIGLLATLNDIALLIGSFADLDMSTANPLDVFRNMIDRMKAPMASMGIAFSASLFGLLGSIILGLMMVSLRRFQGDILSLLGSEVAQHIEFALAHGGFTYSKGALKLGLDKLGMPDDAPHHILVRPTRPIDLATGEPGTFPPGSSGVGPFEQEEAAAVVRAAQAGVTGGAEADSAGLEAQVRVLLRIEERLAESARNEMRALDGALDDFQKQRGDMLRTLAEQTESSNNFRGELQRVGRQLGSIMEMMGKSNANLSDQISELTIRLSGDFTESHRIMLAQIEEQRKLSEKLQK
ncbi:MAG: hypothetical protein FD168_908 [Desulfobulbaceae bacterium]|jgi:hypothetical protein|nr:MAG: hypothetical protein FD168_908 [Desulfobulbaceae bacterium]